MATRRMISTNIINSARFIMMPQSTQALYFHLISRGDDDGVVEAFPVMRLIGATEDELKILVAKNFITILNDELVSHITDWLEHNKIRSDRKIDSIYKDLLIQVLPEVALIEPKDRKDRPKDNQGTTLGRPKDNHGLTLDGVGEVRVGEVRVGEVSNNYMPEIQKSCDLKSGFSDIFKYWNSQPNLITHRVSKSPEESAYKSLIVDGYNDDEIKRSIDTYNLVVSSPKSWLTHKWTIKEFLSQANACRKFIDSGNDLEWLKVKERPKTQRQREAY